MADNTDELVGEWQFTSLQHQHRLYLQAKLKHSTLEKLPSLHPNTKYRNIITIHVIDIICCHPVPLMRDCITSWLTTDVNDLTLYSFNDNDNNDNDKRLGLTAQADQPDHKKIHFTKNKN